MRHWHFAHESGVDCPHAAESALHKAAKQLVVDSGGLMLPEQSTVVDVSLPGGRLAQASARCPSMWVDFSAAEQEACLGEIRADVLARLGHRLLAIEIAVTHFVDPERAQRLCEMPLATLEIDLSVHRDSPWAWESLRQTVIEETAHKRWLCPLELATLQQEAREIAMRDASSMPIAQAHAKRRSSTRKRHLICGRIVDLIILPFGIAIWTPYDPAIIQLIKSIVYPLGGRWNPKFKNWLVPLEGRHLLEEQLVALSDAPPTTLVGGIRQSSDSD